MLIMQGNMPLFLLRPMLIVSMLVRAIRRIPYPRLLLGGMKYSILALKVEQAVIRRVTHLRSLLGLFSVYILIVLLIIGLLVYSSIQLMRSSTYGPMVTLLVILLGLAMVVIVAYLQGVSLISHLERMHSP